MVEHSRRPKVKNYGMIYCLVRPLWNYFNFFFLMTKESILEWKYYLVRPNHDSWVTNHESWIINHDLPIHDLDHDSIHYLPHPNHANHELNHQNWRFVQALPVIWNFDLFLLSWIVSPGYQLMCFQCQQVCRSEPAPATFLAPLGASPPIFPLAGISIRLFCPR